MDPRLYCEDLDVPKYSVRQWAAAGERSIAHEKQARRDGMFWGALSMGILVTICRAFGWL